MRVLVAGGRGFLGRHVVAALNAAGREVYNLTTRPGDVERSEYVVGRVDLHCDITKDRAVRRVLREVEPSVILHLAARSVVKQDVADPTGVTLTNVLGTHNLLEYAPTGCRFVLASSATVYGDTPVPAHELTVLRPGSVYGATKVAAEALVWAYTATGRINGISLRLVANAGAHSTHGLVHDILRKLHGPSAKLELIGEAPGSCKPLVWAGDTARAFLHFTFEQPDYPLPVNVSTEDSITVEEVAHLCMEESGIRKKIRWLGWGVNWAGDVPFVKINTERAASLGFTPRYGKSADAVRVAVRETLGKDNA